jgi:site-specific recombinase XerD
MNPASDANGMSLECTSGGAEYFDILAGRASVYIRRFKASNTLKAYQSDWEDFRKWCETHSRKVLPASADTVILYLSDLAETHKPSTLTRRIASISQVHQIAGHETPSRDANVRMVMAGITRTRGRAQDTKTAILVEDLKQMVAGLPEGVLGIRNRALLLIGFSGGFRRSELVGLDRNAIEITRDGLAVTIRRSKTDQEGRGRKIGIPYGGNADTCPVRSLQAWLAISGIKKGPIFRPVTRHGRIQARRLSTNAVAQIVKRHVKTVGLDATHFSGHSLRSGLATSAAMSGASERAIMNQTGHRSTIMVRRYIRDGRLFKDNVVSALGL